MDGEPVLFDQHNKASGTAVVHNTFSVSGENSTWHAGVSRETYVTSPFPYLTSPHLSPAHTHTHTHTHSFQTGVHHFAVEVLHDAPSQNKWRMTVGVVPRNFDATQRNFTCIGSSQGGWAYVGSTGMKYSRRFGGPQEYGPPFTTGDVVDIFLDLDRETLEFGKNGRKLGVAYNNVRGMLKVGVALTGQNSRVRITRTGPPRKDDCKRRNGGQNEAGRPGIRRQVSKHPSGIPDHDSDVKVLRELEETFRGKLPGCVVDLRTALWLEPLTNLAVMGFNRVQAVQALCVTCVDKVLYVESAIEYLMLPQDTQDAQYAAEAAAAAEMPVVIADDFIPPEPHQRPQPIAPVAHAVPDRHAPPSPAHHGGDNMALVRSLEAQLADARSQLRDSRRRFDDHKARLNREVYLESVASVVADGAVTDNEIQRLELLRRKRGIEEGEHDIVRCCVRAWVGGGSGVFDICCGRAHACSSRCRLCASSATRCKTGTR